MDDIFNSKATKGSYLLAILITQSLLGIKKEASNRLAKLKRCISSDFQRICWGLDFLLGKNVMIMPK